MLLDAEAQTWTEEPVLDGQGQGVVDAQSGLTKVVLARRSDIAYRGHLDPLLLLAALQVQTPLSVSLSAGSPQMWCMGLSGDPAHLSLQVCALGAL